ncbi:unnamed protein product (macronuclear) [Paramecium tetraurelia]|uniref:Poly(A) RNA polymerase mitochondrial-like central palm domain-containing protein n=1 Tax=Paramecium tetraurelia TaxID=5888 RepID=A0DF21_PARTE|nr:uncharacterized protein GSPATT00016464001 [Paramecium tetraurelia]CAK81638.1 unnamed protein product [Paramecium tetraurelia]|eukprot:XP_001449035.1 hypothetical protein (macronuclear) [Paramecium tetraurelia strain d4-2]
MISYTLNQCASFQISENKFEEVTRETKTSCHKKRQVECYQQKLTSECAQEQEGFIGRKMKQQFKRKNDEFDSITCIRNIISLSLSVLEEEHHINYEQQNPKEFYSQQDLSFKIVDYGDIEGFQLPPTAQLFQQQNKKPQKRTKSKKIKVDSQQKAQKNQTLTQKQHPQHPQIEQQIKDKQYNQASSQNSHKLKEQTTSQRQQVLKSLNQIENIQKCKNESSDFDAQFSHIGAVSTTTGNSQSESDDCLLQQDEKDLKDTSLQKQSNKEKYKKKNYNNIEKVGKKQYPNSPLTTPIKRKQLNLNKSKRQDIDEFLNNIKIKSFQNKIRKRICFNRLHYIISTNSDLNIYAYGSFETGLDLDVSDVDIGIWGTQTQSYNQIVNFLQQINSLLKQTPFLVQSKLIQSHMPILKLELNPKTEFYNDKAYIQQNWQSFHLDQQDPGKIIQVDLTWIYQWNNIYNNPHLGFASTTIIKDWVNRFYWYRETILILKFLLKSKNLNDAHTGGISSFCLSIMLTAIYMCKHYTQNDKKLILLDFLKKYATQFDPLKEGIYIDGYGYKNYLVQVIKPIYLLG